MKHIPIANNPTKQQLLFHIARILNQSRGQAASGGGVLALERDEGGVEKHHALVVDEFELGPCPERVIVGAAGHAELEDRAVADSAQAGERVAVVHFLAPGVGGGEEEAGTAGLGAPVEG